MIHGALPSTASCNDGTGPFSDPMGLTRAHWIVELSQGPANEHIRTSQ